MPKAVSKLQQRKLFALERRGELPTGTARRHALKGEAFAKLPKRRHPLECKTCGARLTEKTARGHARLFGHRSFRRIT